MRNTVGPIFNEFLSKLCGTNFFLFWGGGTMIFSIQLRVPIQCEQIIIVYLYYITALVSEWKSRRDHQVAPPVDAAYIVNTIDVTFALNAIQTVLHNTETTLFPNVLSCYRFL